MSRLALFAFSIALLVPAVHAQQPKAPEFELDPAWSSVPHNWVLGEVTSISVDRKDHIWVQHVPQSIPPAQLRAQAREVASKPHLHAARSQVAAMTTPPSGTQDSS